MTTKDKSLIRRFFIFMAEGYKDRWFVSVATLINFIATISKMFSASTPAETFMSINSLILNIGVVLLLLAAFNMYEVERKREEREKELQKELDNNKLYISHLLSSIANENVILSDSQNKHSLDKPLFNLLADISEDYSDLLEDLKRKNPDIDLDKIEEVFRYGTAVQQKEFLKVLNVDDDSKKLFDNFQIVISKTQTAFFQYIKMFRSNFKDYLKDFLKIIKTDTEAYLRLQGVDADMNVSIKLFDSEVCLWSTAPLPQMYLAFTGNEIRDNERILKRKVRTAPSILEDNSIYHKSFQKNYILIDSTVVDGKSDNSEFYKDRNIFDFNENIEHNIIAVAPLFSLHDGQNSSRKMYGFLTIDAIIEESSLEKCHEIFESSDFKQILNIKSHILSYYMYETCYKMSHDITVHLDVDIELDTAKFFSYAFTKKELNSISELLTINQKG
ncbi:MAG: hypothetical protein Q4A21_02810 [bacterium]|nr:hypothetical protein [bacterium]